MYPYLSAERLRLDQPVAVICCYGVRIPWVIRNTVIIVLLLCSLFAQVCHGDIKSENVLVTSWNWVFLADFASFKPTFMSCDNPEDFNFFFDTSRRRVCNIAPERFLTSSTGSSHVRQAGEMVLQGADLGGKGSFR